MFTTLMVLSGIFNVVALSILVICSVCCFKANKRLSALMTEKVALPRYIDCKPTFTKCCVVSSVFLIMDWLLFSSGVNGAAQLASFAYTFAHVWAIALVVLVITEIIINFSKVKEYRMKDALSFVMIRTIWWFILTFIIV